MKRNWKWIGSVMVVVLVGGLVAGGLARRSRAANADDEKTTQVTVARGDVEASVEASGRVVPLTEATLAFDVLGTVIQVQVQEGQRVKAGDALLKLNSDALERAVRSAQQSLIIQEANLSELREGASAEEIAAAEAAVASAQAQLAQLLAGPREQEIVAAEANLQAAQAAVWGAAEQRDQVSAGATSAEVAAVEAQVASAQVQQKIAQDTYDKTIQCATVTSPSGERQEICPGLGTREEQARYNLYAANEALAAAQAQRDQILDGASEEQINAARANLSAAAAQRDAAQAQLDLLLAGSTEAQIAAARAQLAQAQATLATLKAGASDERLAMAEAQVEQARIALQEAQDKLANATLIAPFDGTVAHVLIEEGEWTVSGNPVVVLTDLSALEIELAVDEVDIGQVAVGQPALVTLETWPTEEITAKVTRIAPVANVGTGVVTYRVYLGLDLENSPADLTTSDATTAVNSRIIRPDMTANAKIITRQLADALLVPNRAIKVDRAARRYTVERFVQGGAGASQTETVEISIGLRGATHTQVLSGLEEGDTVLIRAIEKQAAPLGPGQRLFGGR
jgi:HlyD family secretion protein